MREIRTLRVMWRGLETASRAVTERPRQFPTLPIWLWWEAWVLGGMAGLLQHGDLTVAVYNRQFIRKAFALPMDDGAIIFYVFRAICNFNRLPKGDMAQISRSKDPIQKA